jgi:hypothetical protein
MQTSLTSVDRNAGAAFVSLERLAMNWLFDIALRVMARQGL